MSRLTLLLNEYSHGLSADNPSHPSTHGGDITSSPQLFVGNDINFESMQKNELLLSHTVLHFLFCNGGSKNLSITEVEYLHKKIVEYLPNHKYFDDLDEK